MHLLTTVAWYSTWSSIISGLHNHTNAARRSQRAMETVLRKWPPTEHHLITCTADVSAARRTLQRLQISSRDMIASSSSSNLERVSTDCYLLFSACGVNVLPPRPSPLQRCHPCLYPTYTRSAFEGKFELLRPPVRGTPWYCY